MTFFDIVTAAVALLAIVVGWRKGLIKQLFSLVGLVAGGFLSIYFNKPMGEPLGLEGHLASTAGFIIIFVATVIVTSLASKLLKKMLEAIGVGSLDTIGGIVVSIVKFGLLLGIVYICIESLNNEWKFMSKHHMHASVSFEWLCDTMRVIIKWVESLR